MSARENEHGHPHDHDHESRGATIAQRVAALVGALDARGITSDAELSGIVERFLAGAGPNNGARLAARAWRDPEFKRLLLDDASSAIAHVGIDLTHWVPVRVVFVENTPSVHNVIVCTLCSCYPIALLGPSPTWYKSEAYRARIVREPRAVLAEFGTRLPDDVEVRVWDSTAELRYCVLPLRPSDADELDEASLASIVTRDHLIGVAR